MLLCPGALAEETLARVQVTKPRIILNLEAVPIIDCSGIGFIAALYGTALGVLGDLSLLKVRQRPRQLLELCGLARVIPAFETEEDALASISSQWTAPKLVGAFFGFQIGATGVEHERRSRQKAEESRQRAEEVTRTVLAHLHQDVDKELAGALRERQ